MFCNSNSKLLIRNKDLLGLRERVSLPGKTFREKTNHKGKYAKWFCSLFFRLFCCFQRYPKRCTNNRRHFTHQRPTTFSLCRFHGYACSEKKPFKSLQLISQQRLLFKITSFLNIAINKKPFFLSEVVVYKSPLPG